MPAPLVGAAALAAARIAARTIAKRKISNAAAAKIARETVGKAPYGRVRQVISNRSEVTAREGATRFKAAERAGKRIERVKKLTGPVTVKKTAGKTPGDIAKDKQAANAAKRDKLNKDMKPRKRVVSKPEPRKVVKTKAGGTVSRPGKKVDTEKFKKVTAKDIKDVVTRRMVKKSKPSELSIKMKNAADNSKNSFAKSRETEKSESLARREIADKNAEQRANELRNSMNKQYEESGTNFRNPASGKMERTQTNVANPMQEPARKAEVEKLKSEAYRAKKPNLNLSPEARKKFAVKKTANYKIKRGK